MNNYNPQNAPLLSSPSVLFPQEPLNPTSVAPSSTSLLGNVLQGGLNFGDGRMIQGEGEDSLYWLLEILPMGWQIFEQEPWSQALLEFAFLFCVRFGMVGGYKAYPESPLAYFTN